MDRWNPVSADDIELMKQSAKDTGQQAMLLDVFGRWVLRLQADLADREVDCRPEVANG